MDENECVLAVLPNGGIKTSKTPIEKKTTVKQIEKHEAHDLVDRCVKYGNLSLCWIQQFKAFGFGCWFLCCARLTSSVRWHDIFLQSVDDAPNKEDRCVKHLLVQDLNSWCGFVCWTRDSLAPHACIDWDFDGNNHTRRFVFLFASNIGMPSNRFAKPGSIQFGIPSKFSRFVELRKPTK